MVLWGLTGTYENGRLVTTADQAGTSALRDPMDALGFKFKYVYDTPDEPDGGAAKVLAYAEVARAAALLRRSRVGMMGYRDMRLYATLVDGVSLRRVVGVGGGCLRDAGNRPAHGAARKCRWCRPCSTSCAPTGSLKARWTAAAFDKPIRMYLAVQRQVQRARLQGVSLIDVDGVKKLLHFPPGLVLTLLADRESVATIPENDGLGAVTQLIVRYLTGQVGAYFEFYEFIKDRVLVGVPDFIPAGVAEGTVQVRLALRRALRRRAQHLAGQNRPGDPLPAGQPGRPLPHAYRHAARRSLRAAGKRPGGTSPRRSFPGLEVILDTSVDEFAQKVLGQHYIIAYGDHRSQLFDFCRLLGIEVI